MSGNIIEIDIPIYSPFQFWIGKEWEFYFHSQENSVSDKQKLLHSFWSDTPTVVRKNITISDIGHKDLTLIAPIAIYLEQAGDEVLAYSYDLEELAIGTDEYSAVEDMKGSICDLYFLLKTEQRHLGPLQEKHWNYLKKIIKESCH